MSARLSTLTRRWIGVKLPSGSPVPASQACEALDAESSSGLPSAMSPSSASPFDPLEFPRSAVLSSQSAELPIASKLAQLREKLAAEGGPGSTDLALDLVLNEIVQQVRVSTRATGAAVALLRGDEMVCRATTGGNAPDLGVRLDTKTGLSGACVESREPEVCGDTELDDRVDVAACRALGVRSILVLPLLSEERLVGVFEVFSPLPRAFGERDLQTLQGFVGEILKSVQEAKALASAGGKTIGDAAEKADSEEPSTMASLLRADTDTGLPARGRDWLNPLLTVLVIALAILLGALVGIHIGQRRVAKRVPRNLLKSASPVNASVSPAASQAAPVAATISTQRIPLAPASAAPESATQQNGVKRGNLVVYRDGKVVYQASPSNSGVGKSDPGPQSHVLEIPSEKATQLAVLQATAQYPPGIAANRVPGSVQVRVAVDREGAVQNAEFASGPAELASAAVDAAKKWRFTPYSVNGGTVGFQSVVTVRFPEQ